ncbi:MAG TPA: hypothetical protein DCS93_29635 [Microscillaceae bacterium]|nr:hypothetical protein [Microscillaceae bacterium]
MPELLTLSLEEHFWDVTDPLIDKLDQLVNLPQGQIDDDTYKQHLFPAELVALSEVDWIRKSINDEYDKLDTYKQEAALLSNLTPLYEEEAKKKALEKELQQKDTFIDTTKAELKRIEGELDKYTTDEDKKHPTYQALVDKQDELDVELANAQTEADKIGSSLEPFYDLDNRIKAENEALKKFRQDNFEKSRSENITSSIDLKIQKRLNQENQDWQQQTIQDLVHKRNTADTKANQRIANYADVRVNMEEPLKILKEQQAIAKVDKSKVDFDVLHKAMNDMAGVTPGIYKEIIEGVAQNATAAELDKKQKNLKEDMTSKLKDKFDAQGSYHDIQLSVDVGAGVSAGLVGIKATFTVAFSLRVSYDENGKFSVKQAVSGEVKAKGEAGLALNEENQLKLKQQVSGNFSNEDGKTYASLDDFIEAESAHMSSAFLDYSLSKKVMPIEQYKNLKIQQKAVAQQEAAIIGKKDLEKKLYLTGLLAPEKQLTVPDRPQINYVRTNSAAASANAKTSAAVKFANSMGFGVGGSYSRTSNHAISYKQKTINLIDDVAAHPTLGKIYGMKQPQSFGFVLNEGNSNVEYSGQESIEKLNTIETQIEAYKLEASSPEGKIKLETLRSQLKGALERLSVEYQTFVQVENNVAQGDGGQEETVRNNFREARGATDSVNYLKAVSLQYANLRKAYDKSFLDNESINEDDKAFMDDFEKDLKTPKFEISDNAYKKVFNIDQKTPTTEVSTKEWGIAVEAKNFNESLNNINATAPGVQLGIKYTETTTPDKERNDEFSLKFNITSQAKGDNFVAKLLQFSDLKKITGADADEQEVSDSILAALQSMATGNLEVKLHRKGDGNGWHVKYVRGYEVSAKKTKLKGTVANVGGVNLLAGGAISTTHVSTIYEKPGFNSLSYITDVYRAKKIRSTGNDDWKLYDEQYKLLDKMVENIKNGANNISTELESWLTELTALNTAEADEMVDKVRTGLTQLRAGGDAEDFKEVFVELVAKKTAQEDKKLNDQFQTRRTAERKGMKQYAADVLAQRMQTIVDTHQLSGSDAASVEGMLDWAKQRHNKAIGHKNSLRIQTTDADSNDLVDPNSPLDPNNPESLTVAEARAEADAALQESFQTLKSVFGVHYTEKTLDELTSSDNPEDQNQALNLLDTQLDTMLSEQSKVYLDEGLSGELTMDAEGNLKIKPIIAQGNTNYYTADAITDKVALLMNRLSYSTEATDKIDSRGIQNEWQQATQNQQRPKLKSRMFSRSMRSLTSNFSNNKSISKYIAQVMQKALERKQSRRPANAMVHR